MVAIRSSSCSMVAWALGGPPQRRRSSAWILPCGRPVRWWWAADQVVELPAQQDAALGGGARLAGTSRRRWPRATGAAPALGRPTCSAWRLCSSVATWSAVSSPGRPRYSSSSGVPVEHRRAERGAVEDHLVELGGRGQRLEALVQLAAGLLAALGALQQVVVEARRGSSGRPSTWLRCSLHLAGQLEQVRHAGQEHRRGLARLAGPHEAPDRLGEEQRRGGAGGVHPDGQPGNVDALGHHPYRDHPALRPRRRTRRSGPRRRRRRRAPRPPSRR